MSINVGRQVNLIGFHRDNTGDEVPARRSREGAVTVVTDKLGGLVHNPTTGSSSCLGPRLCRSLLSRWSG